MGMIADSDDQEPVKPSQYYLMLQKMEQKV